MVSSDQRETSHASRGLGWRVFWGDRGRILEDDLAAKLNDTPWVRGLNFTKARIVWIIPHGRPNSGAGERIKSVLGMIKDIKRLGPELE
jgi:hypothetical protein